MNARSIVVAVAAAVAAFATPAVQAQAADKGDWVVRGRALHLQSANKDETGLGLSINDKWFPELDIGYFFTPNLAVELVLTYPQKQTVTSTAVGGEIGTFKHLPPTLTFQYHLTAIPGFRPYVGAGLNYTNISDVDILGGAVGLKHNSYGWAAQIGADIPVGGGWLVNLDVKKVKIGTNVYLNSVDQGKFNVDPLLVSVGFGKRF
jgi:outer membrane protein